MDIIYSGILLDIVTFYHSTMQGHHFMELKTWCPCWQDVFHFGREKKSILDELNVINYHIHSHTMSCTVCLSVYAQHVHVRML